VGDLVGLCHPPGICSVALGNPQQVPLVTWVPGRCSCPPATTLPCGHAPNHTAASVWQLSVPLALFPGIQRISSALQRAFPLVVYAPLGGKVVPWLTPPAMGAVVWAMSLGLLARSGRELS
jgi:hypothetical protein